MAALAGYPFLDVYSCYTGVWEVYQGVSVALCVIDSRIVSWNECVSVQLSPMPSDMLLLLDLHNEHARLTISKMTSHARIGTLRVLGSDRRKITLQHQSSLTCTRHTPAYQMSRPPRSPIVSLVAAFWCQPPHQISRAPLLPR